MQIKTFKPTLLKGLYRPAEDSHKGQNGRLLVIGGSELFHASIFWSAQVASKIVDLVHFTSPANENNDLVRQKIKAGFWEGIVVDFKEVEEYIKEDDCVLIGPGMTRVEDPEAPITKFPHDAEALRGRQEPNNIQTTNNQYLNEKNINTRTIVNSLLAKYPDKRWVVDGGALQEVEPKLLNGNMIITPHQREWERLTAKAQSSNVKFQINEQIIKFSKEHQNLTILLKGQVDLVVWGDEVVEVAGGNAGMTKGGTGDVLAGLVAALYCKNDPALAGQVASYVNKKAGESLAETVGLYFNAGDLVEAVPRILNRELQGKSGN